MRKPDQTDVENRDVEETAQIGSPRRMSGLSKALIGLVVFVLCVGGCTVGVVRNIQNDLTSDTAEADQNLSPWFLAVGALVAGVFMIVSAFSRSRYQSQTSVEVASAPLKINGAPLKTNGFCVASLALVVLNVVLSTMIISLLDNEESFMSVFIPLLAVLAAVCAVVGLWQVRHSRQRGVPQRGLGLAIPGLILGLLVIAAVEIQLILQSS